MKTSLKNLFPNLNDEEINELDNYETNELEKAIVSNNEGLVVLNLGEYHASLMMTKMFEKTTKQLTMVVGKFDGNISDKPNYKTAFENCLKNKIPLKVIFVDDDPKETSQACQLLKKYETNNNILLYKATDKTREILKNSFNNDDKLVHFSVFDDNKYRVETVPEKYTAYGSFNDSKYSTNLLNVFENLLPTTLKFCF